MRSMGAAALAAGLAGCSGNGNGTDDATGDAADPTGTDTDTTDDGSGDEDVAVVEASFRADLSDDGSIPGHESTGSEGTGEASFRGTADDSLEFEVAYEDLEGAVNGIHIHGEGSASGGYLVRLFEPSDSEHADEAVVTGEKMAADGGSITDAIDDGEVNPNGDFDGEVETVADLVAYLESPELGETGGVVNIHTEYAPDSELAGLAEPQ